MRPYLDLDAIWVAYGLSEEWVLRGLSLRSDRGECVGIVGSNGSGKSTLAHAIIGVLPHITPGQVRGKAYLDGKDLFLESLDKRLERVGYSFQDVESQILFGRVADVLGMKEIGSDKVLLKRAIEDLGVEHLLGRRPEELSGGEAQRVALITALRRGPGLVLYDEATSALDPPARRAFGKLIRHLQNEGRTVILLGQRSEMLTPYCSRLLTLRDGRLHEESGSDPVHCRSRELAKAFWDTLMKHMTWPKVLFSELKLKGVKFIHKRTGFMLGPIDFSISSGETIAILGPNGSGKTTLFLLLIGALRPLSGGFALGSQEYPSTRMSPWPETITMVLQSPLAQIIGATVEDELKAAVSPTIPLDDRQIRNLLLDHFPYLEFSKDPLQLSYGQQRMLTLISVLLSDHPVLIIEEPEQGLDKASLEYVKTWFQINRRQRARTVLFSTHDLKLATELADRCLLLVDGKVVGQISTSDPSELEEWYFLHTEGNPT